MDPAVVKNPPNDFKLSQPSQWTCRVPAGSRTPRQADTQRQRDVISMSHRSGLGLRPTHLPFSQRPRGLHAAKLPECLRRLVAMRSAYYFQTNDCRSGGHPQHRRHALMQRTVGEYLSPPMTVRSALMQDGGASYLGRGSSQGKPLSPVDSWEERLCLH